MNAPAILNTLHVPAGWDRYLEGEGDPDGALPCCLAVSPQGDQLQVCFSRRFSFTDDHFAMLIAVGFGCGPKGFPWTPETLEQAFANLPAYRRAIVEQPSAPPGEQVAAPADPDEARRRRADAAFKSITSAMRSLHLFEDKSLRASQINPNLTAFLPTTDITFAQDDLARAGRLLLGEIEP